MKANELRIGNYANRKHYDNEIEVIQITGYDLWHSEKQEDVVHEVEWKALSPIPLTEEWLVKFGWGKEKSRNGHRFSCDYMSVQLWGHGIKIKYNNCIIHYQGEDKIKYVHQFQNLYFALTGEELTIK